MSDCDRNFASNGADQVANCQRSCFDFYACDTDADCPDTLPYCNLPQGATEGECSSNCVISSYPGEPGSCPTTDDQGDPLLCSSGECQTCGSNAIVGLFECETVFAGDADQIANCQRSCFDFYACTTNADCPDTRICKTDVLNPHCIYSCSSIGDCPPFMQSGFCDAGQCFGVYTCTTNADCPADMPLCDFGQCLAECVINANCPADRPFCDFGQCFECGTNSDCPADRPLCDVGQCLAECATNADCTDPSEPYCFLGACGECDITAFPGETGSCGGNELCNAGNCEACPTSITLDDCQAEFASIPDTVRADQIAQCERSCFDYYACATNADCPGSLPFCTNGQCGACEVNAFPSATGSCPDIPEGQPGEGPQLCVRTATEAATSICALCSGFAQNDGITTPAGCQLLETNFNENADVVANCQRGCFGFYACTTNADCQDVPGPLAQACTSGVCTDIDECGTNADCPADRPLCESGQCLAECGTNADCPADRPLCDAGQCLAECDTNADCPADRPLCESGQCVVSSVPSSPTFSPLDGMGGGSSA